MIPNRNNRRCADGKEAVEAIEKHRPDLVFLDIQMPEMGGLYRHRSRRENRFSKEGKRAFLTDLKFGRVIALDTNSHEITGAVKIEELSDGIGLAEVD